jgi:MSHA biogenesis protein MshI
MVEPLRRLFMRTHSKYLVSIAVRQGRVNLMVTTHADSLGDAVLKVNDEQAVDSGNYAQAISILLARYEKLNLRKAPTQVVLNPRLVQQVSMDRPQLADGEIQSSLPWLLKDLVDISANDLVADYYDPAIQAAGQDKINVVAAQRSWLEKLIAPLQEARLHISGIINEDLATTRLFATDEPPRVLLAQYGQEQAQLLLIARQKLIVSRQLKPLQSIAQGAGGSVDSYETDNLALELQRSLDYYSGQMRQAPLQHVQLALPGNQAQSIADVLAESLSLQVTLLGYPQWAEELKAGDFSDLGAMAGVAWLHGDLHSAGAEESA